jgi:hypothetical protein
MNAAAQTSITRTALKEPSMTDILTSAPRPTVRSTGPSVVSLVGLEIRKSLSTRSGRAVTLAGALIAPAAVTLLSFSGDELDAVRGPIGALGLVTALVMIPLGVLATAGEWSHRTVQTTFLHVPDRTKVVAAKVAAVAVMGAVLAAVASAIVATVVSVAPVGDPSWDGVPSAMAVSVAAAAAFAVMGAGVGAALANTPAALTGLYLVLLGGMPALRLVRPEIAAKVDPTDAMLQLAFGTGTTSHSVTLIGWVVVTTVAGIVLTRRRAVS